ncbi:DUF2884 family protein [Ferrimonas senticii]|uniref:DUF2884 family protein n=1 Tax=Ferrimonas senticii TaxID=394566 RepID=UPI0004250E5F|nr:DUF2884 family protein [Ferrimonas senticii]
MSVWSSVRAAVIATLMLPLAVLPVAAVDFDFSNQHCQMALGHDVQVSPTKLVISDTQQQRYRFEQGQLYVDGQAVQLTPQQRQQLQQFQQRLLDGSQELLALVNDALTLAAGVISGIMQEFQLEQDQPDQWLAKLQQHIEGGLSVNDGEYHLTAAGIDSSGEQLGDAIGAEIEQAITSNIGQLLITVGQSLSDGEGSFEQRLEAFAQSMEQMGERIEQQVEQQGQQLEQRGQQLCDQWQQIQQQESQLHQALPQLKAYPIIDVADNELTWLR